MVRTAIYLPIDTAIIYSKKFHHLGFSIDNLKLFETDLVGLLLNSLSDEAPEIVVMGLQLVEEAGKKRLQLAKELGEKIDAFVTPVTQWVNIW